MINPDFLKRVITLAMKNGDRVVVTDPETDKAVVVLDLESYEKLSNGVQVSSQFSVRHNTTQPIEEKKSIIVEPSDSQPSAPTSTSQLLSTPVARSLDEVRQENGFTTSSVKKKSSSKESLPSTVLADLTQDQLLDKINREIGAWKNAQDRKHIEELQSAVQRPSAKTSAVMEQEDKFYLEPIE